MVNITWQATAEGGVPRPSLIVIELNPEDDPDGRIADLLVLGHLAAFLRVCARPGDLGAADSAEDAYSLLSAFGHVTALCNSRLEAMQLAARDQWRMGWGRIANAVGAARSTVKNRIQATRERYAWEGHWYDTGGLHTGSPETARSATLTAWDRDGQEPYLDAADPDYRPAGWPGQLPARGTVRVTAAGAAGTKAACG